MESKMETYRRLVGTYMKQYCYQCGEEYEFDNGFGDFNEFCSEDCINHFSSSRF